MCDSLPPVLTIPVYTQGDIRNNQMHKDRPGKDGDSGRHIRMAQHSIAMGPTSSTISHGRYPSSKVLRTSSPAYEPAYTSPTSQNNSRQNTNIKSENPSSHRSPKLGSQETCSISQTSNKATKRASEPLYPTNTYTEAKISPRTASNHLGS